MKVCKLSYLIVHTDFSSLFIFIPAMGMPPVLLPAAVSFSKPAHEDTAHQGAVYMPEVWFELHIKTLTRESFVRKTLVRFHN